MKYLEFRDNFIRDIVINVKEIYKHYPNFDRRRLTEWQKKNYLTKIINNYYIFNEIELNELLLFLIANRINDMSYISLETALSYYGLIPEAFYQIKSVSTKKTKSFNTKIADFSFNSISGRLFWGYSLIKSDKYSILMATPEKALIDFLYLTKYKTKDDFYELRFNNDIFSEIINQKKINSFLKLINNKLLIEKFKTLTEVIINDRH